MTWKPPFDIDPQNSVNLPITTNYNGSQLNDTLASKLDLAGGDTITASGASVVPLTIKGASGQTANLLTVEDSAGTDLVVVEPSGNVGIGTSSPAQKLHAVSSQNRILSESIATSDGIFAAKTTVGEWLFGTGIGIAADVFNIFHATGTVGERLRLDDDGLIIGTGRSLGAWTAYTPTLGGTGWALGNGTVSGRYCQVGKTIKFRARVVFGSTSTFGAAAAPTLTLPVAALDTTSLQEQSASFGVQMEDVSLGARYVGFAWRETTTEIAIARKFNTDDQVARIDNTLPFAWATSDAIYIAGTYEAA